MEGSSQSKYKVFFSLFSKLEQDFFLSSDKISFFQTVDVHFFFGLYQERYVQTMFKICLQYQNKFEIPTKKTKISVFDKKYYET